VGGFVSRTSSCALPKKIALHRFACSGFAKRGFLPLHLKTFVMRFAGSGWLRLKNKFMRLAEKISLAPLRLFGLCQKRLFTASPQDIRHALCGSGNFASRT